MYTIDFRLHWITEKEMYLYDTEGKKYLDFAAGFAVSGLGYDNKELNQA